jgi:hypothetical protein
MAAMRESAAPSSRFLVDELPSCAYEGKGRVHNQAACEKANGAHKQCVRPNKEKVYWKLRSGANHHHDDHHHNVRLEAAGEASSKRLIGLGKLQPKATRALLLAAYSIARDQVIVSCCRRAKGMESPAVMEAGGRPGEEAIGSVSATYSIAEFERERLTHTVRIQKLTRDLFDYSIVSFLRLWVL